MAVKVENQYSGKLPRNADFAQTINLARGIEYDALYIFKYSERPATPAARLADNVTRSQKADRFAALDEMQKRIQQRIYRSYVGRELQVLAEGPSSKTARDLKGHSTCHKVVNFPAGPARPGQIVQARVTEAKVNSLYAEVISAA